jgi:hypothetical protein
MQREHSIEARAPEATEQEFGDLQAIVFALTAVAVALGTWVLLLAR